MGLITSALRRPITVVVAVIGVVLFSFLAIRNMPIDIFPKLGLPTFYVAQPYGGLSPDQMEGFVTSYYEYHFLYVTGIKFVESKSIQGVSLIKLEFHEGADMNQAVAKVVAQVNRSRAFMPPGTVPPFIVRYDAGSAPVGQLVFRSETKSLGEIQDLALFKVRPMFSTLPGVSAPPLFGGNQRTAVVRVDPDRLRSYKLSPEEVIQALAKGNSVAPSGNIRVDDLTYITAQNSVVKNIKDLETIPLLSGSGPTVFIRDVATVENSSDIATGYALINGKRAVYIPVSKRSDASTWDVVKHIKAAMPAMQAAVPDDISVSYEFDQSGYVLNSLNSLVLEGALGAILTGLMVFLFLGDRRSALIVIMTIPLALLSAVVGLWLTGQTLNIMTLVGLALAIGILVDEATVTIENIHRHLELGKPKAYAILDACREIALPKLLILFSILAVFVPAFFMSGVPRAMFLPLTLSVGFAMIASFLLSQTLVPIVSNWIIREGKFGASHASGETRFDRFRERFLRTLGGAFRRRGLVMVGYFAGTGLLIFLAFTLIGTEIFPKVDAGRFQIRLRAPTGTRIERTEAKVQQTLQVIERLVGKENVEITSAFVGVQPSSYPVNTIYLWTSGPHEAVILTKLNKGAGVSLEKLKEQIREQIREELPEVAISFEPADLVDQVMSLGAPTPIEIAVTGKNLAQGRQFAGKIKEELERIPYLRDVQFVQPLDYPTFNIEIDRERTGQLGLTVADISQSLVAATSSSRFTQPNYFLDPTSGTAYQVQVEVPQALMNDMSEVGGIPVRQASHSGTQVREAVTVTKGTSVGEYDRLNQQRMVTLSANTHQKDLGSASKAIHRAIQNAGEPPAGLKVAVRGQVELLGQTLSELEMGLGLAILVIFLMLTANFQSFRVALAVLSTIPAVVAGSLLLLLLTGSTLNIQSFMGMVMSLGVSIANAILFVTYAEQQRRLTGLSVEAAMDSAGTRLRPILMTSLAMIAGMIPLSLGLGECGEQTAPLGIAVIGGLTASTFAALLLLPMVYASLQRNASVNSASLDPEDGDSIYAKKPI